MKSMYPESIQALGTFGATGNALFFFCSGYTLMLARQDIFSSWYKRRISRIWPTVFIYFGLIAPLFWLAIGYDYKITPQQLWLGGRFWFIKCIAVYYVFYWLIMRYCSQHINKLFYFSIVPSIVVFFLLPVYKEAIYATPLRYVFFFNFMLLGAILAKRQTEQRNLAKDLIITIVCIILFYAIQFVGKGKSNYLYYIQIFSIIPLILFVYYFYQSVNKSIFNNFLDNTLFGKIIRFVAALCLEVYMVGALCITPDYNYLFPLNFIIVFMEILIISYIVKVLSNFIIQSFQDKPYSFKQMFFII